MITFEQINVGKPNTYDATGKLLIEDLNNALTDAISRSGVSPNTITADLDLNGYSILNMDGESAASGDASSMTFTATDNITSTNTQSAIEEVDTVLVSHVAETDNPHSVTASQVGLGNVDNTADADKAITDAEQTAFDLLAPLDSAELERGATCDDYLILTTSSLSTSGYLTETTEDGVTTLSIDTDVSYVTNVGHYTIIRACILYEFTVSLGTIEAGGTVITEITGSSVDNSYIQQFNVSYSGTDTPPAIIFSVYLPTSNDDDSDAFMLVARNMTSSDITLDDDLPLTLRAINW